MIPVETNNENVLYTITTKGCQSCNILDKLVNEALKLTKREVEYIKQDVSEVNKTWIKKNNIEDFPTTFLIKNGNIKFKFTGTWPSIVIARWIDVQLK